MNTYKKWIDFVIYRDTNRVLSKSERLDCTNAVRPNSEDAEDANLTKIKKHGFVITLDEINWDDDDEFEVMKITDGGYVTIWTKKRVWFLQKHPSGERLICIERHPEFQLIREE